MKIKILFLYLLAVPLFVSPVSVYADATTEELKKQIEALQKRVEELESALNRQSLQEVEKQESLRSQTWKSWDPFEEMESIQDQMNRMFQNSFNRRELIAPGLMKGSLTQDYDININETKNGYEIKFNTSGLNKDKIDIKINDHSITIKGEHKEESKQQSPNSMIHSQSFGTFMQTVPLPMDADTTKVKTEKEGDILVIRIPKKV